MIETPKKLQDICEIVWKSDLPYEWLDLFKSVKRANLLQSFEYARGLARINRQKIRFGIIKINGSNAGVLIVLEAGVFKNAIHGVIIDRAPLWLDGYGSPQNFEAFLLTLSKEFPKRFGRKIRFIPEVENLNANAILLKKYNYKKISAKGYQTIWLDLRPDLEVLRKNLNAKWRNTLNKSEKNGLELIFSDNAEHYSWLIQHYAVDKAMRKYDGASVKTINALANEFSRGQNMYVGSALLDGHVIASILIFNHGSSATYQVGYTSDIGRDKCAHHILFWNAIIELKERDVHDFDLGGINDKSAKGVKRFKSGLGGKVYETLGIYS